MTLYVVRPGDTLYGVARHFGVTSAALAALNQLADPDRLPVGLALVIPAGGAAPTASMEVNGFVYPGVSEATLTETLPSLTFLSPLCYRVGADGTLLPLEDQSLITAAYAGGAAPLLTAANIDERGFSSDIAHAVLTDSAAQDKFITNALALLRARNYYGLALDFEYIYPFDRGSYNQFAARLAETLHARGYYFITVLAPKTADDQPGLLYEAHDYAAHGRVADRVILMTYEWGYTYSPPRAVSPVDRMRDVLDYAVTAIPPGKILLGFSNYGYSWALPWHQGDAARVISSAAAADLAASVYAPIRYDSVAQAPHFTYADAAGVRREVWFEDPRSWRARLELAMGYGLAGISIWTVNRLYRPGLAVLESVAQVEKIL